MSPAYIFFVVAHTLASVKAQKNFYPCNIHTDYTPTVSAPTYSATLAYPEPTTTTPTDGSIVLVAGASPHQGYVMVNYDGGYRAISSCKTDYCNTYTGTGGMWSCSEAGVSFFQRPLKSKLLKLSMSTLYNLRWCVINLDTVVQNPTQSTIIGAIMI